MSSYVKSTNFATKDTLPTGDSGKIVKGTEIDSEFNAIASAISSKADTASPTFTGTPLAPTAASGSNTTQLATTAFVTGAVADSLTSTATLTNKTLTSPTINNGTLSSPSLTSPSMSTIVNTGTLTLPTSTDTVVGRATTDTLTNKTIALGSNTVSGTKAQFNTAVTDTDISFLNDFTGSNQSLTTNGYQKLPGGLIIQWGYVAATNGTATTFPIAFPTACLNVTLGGQGGAFENIYVSSFTTTTVTIIGGYSPPAYYMAIGY